MIWYIKKLSLFLFVYLLGVISCQSSFDNEEEQYVKIIKISETKVPVGASFALYTTIPEELKNRLIWSSSDETVASVDQNGIVSAHKEGHAEISVLNGTHTEICSLSISSADEIGSFDSFYAEDIGANQSMVIYSDLAVFFNNSSNSAKLYDLTKGQLLKTFVLDSGPYHNPHCNTACLGDKFASVNSIFPLIYVSQWDAGYERACFVYDLSRRDGKYVFSLVQRINLSRVSDDFIGKGPCDFVVDCETSQLVSISYKTRQSISQGTATFVNRFPLPSLSDGDEVLLKDGDIIDTYVLPLFPYRQDIVSFDGKFFVNMGGVKDIKAKLVVIDSRDMHVVSVLPLFNVRDSEPEGIAVYNDLISITFGDSKVYSLW